MSKFQVMDLVQAKASYAYKDLIKGHRYQVSMVNGEWLQIGGNCYPHHESCFEKVNEMNTDKLKEPTIINGKAKPKGKPVANTYYVRRVGGGSPKVVHMTFEAARNEANRLAELTPDAEFQVLAVAYTVKKVPVYTTESTEYSV